MLQAIHIRKQFQRSGEVLRDVSFTLGDGEFLSVIGPSGAGKTTLFRILNGTELCSGGEVLYGGTHFEAARGREKRAVQQGIGTIYQDFCLVENLSAIQNVLNACLPDMSLAASLLGAFGRERSEQAAAILREVGLADKLEEPVKKPLRRAEAAGGHRPRLMRNPPSCWRTSRWRPGPRHRAANPVPAPGHSAPTRRQHPDEQPQSGPVPGVLHPYRRHEPGTRCL
ncbi:MAG: ATP-binding cassette domain-containing protein [Dysosmobacter welbionis]